MVSSNDVEWKSVFEEGTLHRTFEIIVEDKTFFVNPSFLAERSSFFETLLFGDFKEKKGGKAVLKEVKPEDFENFLFVLGADPKKRKKVTVSNFSIMANFSHLWDVETLREDCVAYIGSFYTHDVVDVTTAIDICCACEKIKVPVSLLKLVAARLARFSVKVLAENGAHDQLSSRMSTAVYLASQQKQKTNSSVSVPVDKSQVEQGQCCHVGCKATNSLSPVNLFYLNFCPSHLGEARDCAQKRAMGENGFAELSFQQSPTVADEDGVIDDMFFPTVQI